MSVLEVSWEEPLEAIIGQDPRISSELRMCIHKAIGDFRFDFLQKRRIRYWGYGLGVETSMNGPFDSDIAQQTLRYMGPEETVLELSAPRLRLILNHNTTQGVDQQLAWMGSSYLSTYGREETVRCCKINGTVPDKLPLHGLFYDIDHIIFGFAVTALSLMNCQFDRSELRVRHDVITATFVTAFGKLCLDPEPDSSITSREIFLHIIQLCVGAEGLQDTAVLDVSHNTHILGLSSGDFTVYSNCLFKRDCYDNQGRFFTLQSGRIALGCVLRSITWERDVEDQFWKKAGVAKHRPSVSSIAAGSFIEPHYRPSHTRIYMDAVLTNDAILIQVSQGQDVSSSLPFLLAECIAAMLGKIEVPRCEHSPNSPHQVKQVQHLAVMGFLPFDDGDLLRKDVVSIVALHGNKAEQLVSCGVKAYEFEKLILQTLACLKCCLSVTDNADYACIIIGD